MGIQTEKLQAIFDKLNRLGISHFLNAQEISKVENKLNVSFSPIFKLICKQASYEFLGGFDFYNFGLETNASVIQETLNARLNGALPDHFLVLYEDDASIILMQVGTTEPQEEKVFWIAVEDYDRLCKGETLEYKHHIFLSFTDFFEYLLTEEEKERGLISKGT